MLTSRGFGTDTEYVHLISVAEFDVTGHMVRKRILGFQVRCFIPHPSGGRVILQIADLLKTSN